MLTKKELSYVSGWAKKVPYPGLEYTKNTLKKLASVIDCYDKYYSNKQYELVLSNGEQLSFEILNRNLCHLLGIDFKNLSNEYFDEYRYEVLKLDSTPKSYELLKSIVDNMEDVIKYDFDRNGSKAINYYRVMVKCSIFEKLSDFSKFNFGVINFDKGTYQKNSEIQTLLNSDKFLYVQSNEPSAPYFMMGILKDRIISSDFDNQQISDFDNQQIYVPETLFAPVKVADFFKNQEVVIPTQILISDDEKMQKSEATPSEKIALLNQYRSIIKELGLSSSINIYGDYESMLCEQENVKKLVK